MRVNGNGLPRVALSLLLIFATVSAAFQTNTANAAQILNRSLTLVAGATDGGSKAGGVVKHEFKFDLPSSTPIGSIKFEYCTIASGVCTMPVGLVTTSATLDFEDGSTGWTMDATSRATNGAPYIYKAVPSAANTTVTIRLATITNPTANNTSFFTRIFTYASSDATGAPVDSGTVTASTAEAIDITGIMPESLIFCTGATVTANCSSTTPGDIAFDQLFSPTDTATATSQMAASTNATTGYVIAVKGNTLQSGSNSIPAMTTAGAGVPGTGQFGMNLRLNTITDASSNPLGLDLAAPSDGVNLKGQALTGYDTPDQFFFDTTQPVADSAFGGAGPTNSQVYTSSYIVNVAGNQLAGTYTTTLTYICTPTF